MKQSKSPRVSWPPTDLQRFSAHLIARRSVHPARFTEDFSPYLLHNNSNNNNYQSKLEAGHEEKSQDRLSVAGDREYSSILEDDKVHTKQINVRPSKSSTTFVENCHIADQQIAEYEASVVAVECVSDHHDDEPLDPVINEIDDVEASIDDQLRGWRFALVMVAIMAGQFMTSFDGYVISKCWLSQIWEDRQSFQVASILLLILQVPDLRYNADARPIATAIPRITSDFNSLDQVGWYGSAYFVMAMGTQPLFGRAFKRFPTRTMLLVAVALMTLGAIITAAAPGSIVFIIGRAITGASVSAFFSGGLMIISSFVPFLERPIYLSLSMAMTAVASVVGPIVSGFLTDNLLTWRFAFWMNLRTSSTPLRANTEICCIFPCVYLHC